MTIDPIEALITLLLNTNSDRDQMRDILKGYTSALETFWQPTLKERIEERAAVVKYLREGADSSEIGRYLLNEAADAIEKGEHHK